MGLDAYDVAVVGAGPYGLSTAAHLGARGATVCTFGRPMEFWRRNMPKGMLLRSAWEASHIADPDGRLTLDAYEAESGRRLERPIALDDFVDYGRWYQEKAVPDVDERSVVHIERGARAFELTLSDGVTVEAARVVVAAGLAPFAWKPPAFRHLPAQLASHTADHPDLGRFAGRRVAVIGCGQSGVESAALLREAGAAVELFARAPAIRWLARPRTRGLPRPLVDLLYPPTDVGPPPLNWIVALPQIFRRFPESVRPRIAYRCIRPAAAEWLRERVRGVRITPRSAIVEATARADGVELRLSDGDRRTVDHVLLATGYRVDLARLTFLSDSIAQSVASSAGGPILTRDLEASIPGLYFVGAAAAESIGPIMRFVVGTTYAARSVSEHVLHGQRSGMRGTVRDYARRRERLSTAVT